MTDIAELKGMLDQINAPLTELRGEVDALKSAMPNDVVTADKFDRMAEEITGKLADLQAAQAKLKAKAERPEAGDETAALEAKAAWSAFVKTGEGGKDGGVGRRLEVRAMSTDVNPDGGYLVYPQLSQTVVDRVFETSPLRQYANIERTDSTSLELLIDDDEAGARWIGEGASGGQTDTAQVGRKVIALHKIEADPRLTVEMTQSAYLDAEAWHARKVADKFARTENTAFVTGTGVDQPRGLLTYDAWASAGVYERNKIEQVNMLGASALTAGGLIKLQNALKEKYQPGAIWAMKRATFGAALQLKGNDQFYFSPVIMRDGVASMQMLGKPVVFMDDMPAVAANALSIAYADFSMGYTIADGQGLTVLRDPFTNKGFITFYTTKRVGGDVSNFDAIKIGKVAA